MEQPRAALVGAVDGQVLRAAGFRVVGALQVLPYDDPRDVPSYLTMDDLLEDGLDAVALDGADNHLVGHLPDLLAAGLRVLLPTPAPQDLDVLRLCRDEAPDADVLVGLTERWEPWATTTTAAAPLPGEPVLQCTVRGWPRGATPAAELVDLVRRWCGDVVTVIAAPAPLPATELAPGVPVAWALLHEGGTTTLVSHENGPPLVRLSYATARWEAGPLGARWVGGAEVPLLPRADGSPHVDDTLTSMDAVPLPTAPPGTAPGLLCTARALARGAAPELWGTRWPAPARLDDLQAVARVLAALRTSARTEAPAPVG